MKSILINSLLHILFYPSPKITFTEEEAQQFNDLFITSCKNPDKLIRYNLPAPKYKFLYYLTYHKPIVLHGSNIKEIEFFEPRKQTLFNGQITTSIFATKDPIWSFFYAVLDKKKIVGDIRNASISSNSKKNLHFYSLSKQTLLNKPWITGMVYLLPEEHFSLVKGTPQFNEWISNKTVSPVAKIEIEPYDFHFLNKVASHRNDESIIKSWLLYKIRTKLK